MSEMDNALKRKECIEEAGVGAPRDHVSYFVRVAGKTSKSAGTVYWPRVAGLKKA